MAIKTKAKFTVRVDGQIIAVADDAQVKSTKFKTGDKVNVIGGNEAILEVVRTKGLNPGTIGADMGDGFYEVDFSNGMGWYVPEENLELFKLNENPNFEWEEN